MSIHLVVQYEGGTDMNKATNNIEDKLQALINEIIAPLKVFSIKTKNQNLVKNMIRFLAIISVEQDIKATEIYNMFSFYRSECINGKKVLPEESHDVKEFRNKVEIFLTDDLFDEYLTGKTLKRWERRRDENIRKEFEREMAKEIIIASYKLAKDDLPINPKMIFQTYKDWIPEKPRNFNGEHWGGREHMIELYIEEFFERIIQYKFHLSPNNAMLKIIKMIEAM